MAHIFAKTPDPAAWQVHHIEGSELVLGPHFACGAEGVPPTEPPRIKRFPSSTGAESWLLIASPGSVRINGNPVPLGLRILHDKDEVQIRGCLPFYFSTECLPQVERFLGEDQVVYCGRCHDRVDPGTEIVRCPACRVVFHERPDRPCWTYTETCPCSQPTALTGSYRWQPDPEAAA